MSTSDEPVGQDQAQAEVAPLAQPAAPAPRRPSTPPFPTARDTVALAVLQGIANRFPTNTVALAFRGQQGEEVKPDLARRRSQMTGK
jgi:hypothetical protein